METSLGARLDWILGSVGRPVNRPADRVLGGYVGGCLPYGFRRGEDGAIAEIPEQVTVLKRIFAWATEGKPPQWICDRLQGAGVPTQKGRRWRASTIQRILVNDFYTNRIEIERG